MHTFPPESSTAPLDAALQIVAGKGGVGRTVIASALALRLARRGHPTLLLEVNAPDNAAACLEVAPSVDHPTEVLPNLWLCRMTPAGSMAEYALMILRFRALYSLVFDNRLVRYMLRSIPSLAEFTMLGKAWFHSVERAAEDEPKYARMVIDAPATGHALTFLSVARTVHDVAPAGTMKTAAGRMADTIEAPTTRMHVVAVPEEMPVNEGLDLVRAARERLHVRLGLGILNQRLAPVFEPSDGPVLDRLEVDAALHRELEPYVRCARRHQARWMLQEQHAERFRRGSQIPLLSIPLLPERGRALIERIALLMDGCEVSNSSRASDGGPGGARGVDEP
ncbi:MAG: ATPase [Deltaproteobacteria bacterium]|nr:ATPase [Deltaproteobacteria bacterium]